jgi:2-isopropylmalate synthase
MTVAIYDTTLRDGCQAYGFSLTVEDKLRVAQRLDVLGVAYVEGGWPGSNPRDEQFFQRARRVRWKQARLAAFGSTRRAGVPADEDVNLQLLLAAETPVATIVGKASAEQVRVVLGLDPGENLELIEDSVAFLKGAGREVVFDAEHFFDGYRDDPAYAVACLAAAARAGADWLVLCDTNGGTLPGAISAAVRDVVGRFGERVGIHTHNDSELAVANALAAVEAGARQVQGTVNGYGERTGNANLCSIIPNLQLKMGLACLPAGSLAQLTELSRYVSELGNGPRSLKLPYVGPEAFAHKAGLHVNAVTKAAETYEHVPPQSVGNHRQVLVSDLSGQSNIRTRLSELGIAASADQIRSLLGELKRREHGGMEYEGADASFELMARRATQTHDPAFHLLSYSVAARHHRRGPSAEATVKVRVESERMLAAAEGVGPVHALDRALRKSLLEAYPELAGVRLTDYKVRVVDNETGTGARVRVWMQATDGRRAWNTAGASANIVTASADALVDSLEYYLQSRSGQERMRATG